MKSGFFDNTEVVSEDFARLVSGIVGNGVLDDGSNSLEVSPGGGMKVSVSVGYCWIEGHFGKVETPEKLNIEAASGSAARIDRIVARCDYSSCKVSLTVIKGEETDNPTPPPIVRDGTYYDIGLATVSVPAGTLEITTELITDTRTDTSVCGGCIMRTGEKIALDGKADKSEVAALESAIGARLDKDEGDIAELKARGLVRKTFESASIEHAGHIGSDTYSLEVPAELSGLGVLRLTVSVEVTFKHNDNDETYTGNGSTAVILIGIGDGTSANFDLMGIVGSGSSDIAICSASARCDENKIYVNVAISGYSAYSSISAVKISASNISGVFLT